MEGEVDKMPFVSIVLPVKNEEKHIADCLEHVFKSVYPKDRIEVLVIEGGSEDRTIEIVRAFMSKDVPISLLSNPSGQRCSGLNIGIKAAKGDIILRLDARSLCPPDYISKCIGTLIDSGAENVGGIARIVSKTTWERAIGVVMSSPVAIDRSRFRAGRGSRYVHTVYLGCFRREVFDKFGPFDEEASIISEDSDMNRRISMGGGKVYLNSDIVVDFCPRDNFGDFWRLYFRYGGASAGYLVKHRKSLSWLEVFSSAFWRQFITPLCVVTFVLLAALSLFSAWFRNVFAVLLAVGLVTDLAISSTTCVWQGKVSLLPRLLVLFPCMYFAHGSGFLKRLTVGSWKGRYWSH